LERHAPTAASAASAAPAVPAPSPATPSPQTAHRHLERIASPLPGRQLCVIRGAAPSRAGLHAPAPTIYVHGATFPSTLAVAWRFDGVSWMDVLVEAGLDVWGFDFLGYGGSDRYGEMQQPAHANRALGRTPLASRQVAAVVRHVIGSTGAPRVNLIAHSWGTQPAAAFAAACPDLVERLVLFGPVLQREPDGRTAIADPKTVPAHGTVTLEAQWKRFTEDVPAGHPPVLLARHFERWGQAYLDTDPGSRSRIPPAVQVPLGPQADIAATWRGGLAYDPAAVRAPTLLVRGEWDSVCADRDAAWFECAYTATPWKRDLKLARGTHLMHLEESRLALWDASRDFLAAAPEGPVPSPR